MSSAVTHPQAAPVIDRIGRLGSARCSIRHIRGTVPPTCRRILWASGMISKESCGGTSRGHPGLGSAPLWLRHSTSQVGRPDLDCAGGGGWRAAGVCLSGSTTRPRRRIDDDESDVVPSLKHLFSVAAWLACLSGPRFHPRRRIDDDSYKRVDRHSNRMRAGTARHVTGCP